MRILLQLLADLLIPGRRRSLAPGEAREIYLRTLLVLVIVLFCGPEVFAAADLIAVLDLLGATLFLIAFAAGYRLLLLVVLGRLKTMFLPSEWTILVKAGRHPALVTHGITLIAFNVLIFSLHCVAAIVGTVEMVKALI